MALALRRVVPQLGRNLNRVGTRPKPLVLTRSLRSQNRDCLLPPIVTDWGKIIPAGLGVGKRLSIINLKITAVIYPIVLLFGCSIMLNPDNSRDDKRKVARFILFDFPVKWVGTVAVSIMTTTAFLFPVGLGIVALKRSSNLGNAIIRKYASLRQLDNMKNPCDIVDYTSSGSFWKYFLYMIYFDNVIYKFNNWDKTENSSVQIEPIEDED